MESQMKRIHMLGLKRPSVLSLVLPVSNMWGMSRSQLMATLTQVGDARVALAEVSYLYPASSVLARCVETRSAPAFALNLHDGVSPTTAKWFHWEHNRRACNCLFGKIGKTTAHQGGLRAEYEALSIRLVTGTWAAGAWWDSRGS